MDNDDKCEPDGYDGVEPVLIDIDSIWMDAGTQMRPRLDKFYLERYAELYRDGGPWAMKPIRVVFDGKRHIPSNGFHRITSAKAAGLTKVAAFVKPGTLDDATIDACAANKEDQVSRCRDTVQKAVCAILAKKPNWSDKKMANHVGVHFNTVYNWRRKLEDAAKAGGESNAGGGGEEVAEKKEKRTVLATNGQTKTVPPRKKNVPDARTPPPEVIGALPADLADVFADQTLPDLARSLRVVVRELASADILAVVMSFRRTHPWVDPKVIDQYVGEATRALTAVAEQIEGNLPSVVCPECQGEGSRGEDCPVCKPEGHKKSAGYLPGWRHNEFLSEKRLAAGAV